MPVSILCQLRGQSGVCPWMHLCAFQSIEGRSRCRKWEQQQRRRRYFRVCRGLVAYHAIIVVIIISLRYMMRHLHIIQSSVFMPWPNFILFFVIITIINNNIINNTRIGGQQPRAIRTPCWQDAHTRKGHIYLPYGGGGSPHRPHYPNPF